MFHSFRAAVADARGHGDLYFAALLSARSYPKSLRSGKMALARMDLYSGDDGLGLSLAVPQPRPFLPRCGVRLIAWRVACGRSLVRPRRAPIVRPGTTCPKKPFTS